MKALRILLIEDDATLGMLVAEILEEMGHDVFAIATTEADAVKAGLHDRPDLMIVDAQLGAGSGVRAVEKILRTGFIPHLFTSGASVQTDRPNAVVLQKPYRETDLAWAVERALAQAA